MKAIHNGVNRQAVPEGTTSGCACISLSKGRVLLFQTCTRKRNDTSQIEKNLFHFKLHYGANLGSPWPSPRGCGDFSWKLRFQCVTSSSVMKQKSPWSTLLLLHLVQPGSGVSNVFQFIRIYFRPTNLYSVLFPEMWWGSNYYVKGESVAVWNCVSLESCLPFQF